MSCSLAFVATPFHGTLLSPPILVLHQKRDLRICSAFSKLFGSGRILILAFLRESAVSSVCEEHE